MRELRKETKLAISSDSIYCQTDYYCYYWINTVKDRADSNTNALLVKEEENANVSLNQGHQTQFLKTHIGWMSLFQTGLVAAWLTVKTETRRAAGSILHHLTRPTTTTIWPPHDTLMRRASRAPRRAGLACQLSIDMATWLKRHAFLDKYVRFMWVCVCVCVRLVLIKIAIPLSGRLGLSWNKKEIQDPGWAVW